MFRLVLVGVAALATGYILGVKSSKEAKEAKEDIIEVVDVTEDNLSTSERAMVKATRFKTKFDKWEAKIKGNGFGEKFEKWETKIKSMDLTEFFINGMIILLLVLLFVLLWELISRGGDPYIVHYIVRMK